MPSKNVRDKDILLPSLSAEAFPHIKESLPDEWSGKKDTQNLKYE